MSMNFYLFQLAGKPTYAFAEEIQGHELMDPLHLANLMINKEKNKCTALAVNYKMF